MTINEVIIEIESIQNGRIINRYAYEEVNAIYKTAKRVVEDFARGENSNLIILWNKDGKSFKMREILENDYIPSDDYYFVTFEEDRE
jgi:hypothetical protein